MYVPVFGKTVAFTNLAGIALAIRTIMPFHESGIDRAANSLCFYGCCRLGFSAKDNTLFFLDHPFLSARFVNRCIFHL